MRYHRGISSFCDIGPGIAAVSPRLNGSPISAAYPDLLPGLGIRATGVTTDSGLALISGGFGGAVGGMGCRTSTGGSGTLSIHVSSSSPLSAAARASFYTLVNVEAQCD